MGLIFKSVFVILKAFSIFHNWLQFSIINSFVRVVLVRYPFSPSHLPAASTFCSSIETFIEPSNFRYLLQPLLLIFALVSLPLLTCFSSFFNPFFRFASSFLALASEKLIISLVALSFCIISLSPSISLRANILFLISCYQTIIFLNFKLKATSTFQVQE